MLRDSLRVDVEILLEKSALVGHEAAQDIDGDTLNLNGPIAVISEDSEGNRITQKQVISIRKLFFQSNKDKQAEILQILSENISKKVGKFRVP